MRRLKSALHGAALAAGLIIAAPVYAQSWPARPVTLVVPYAAGGPTDLAARALQPVIQDTWKQALVIENRAGAGGVVGTASVAQSQPNGYTLLFNSNVALAKLFIKDLPYAPDDLRPLVELGGASYVILANAEVPVKNLRELIAYLKQNGTAVRTGVTPNNLIELDAHLFNEVAGAKAQIVPYNSGAQIVTALMRNEVNFYLASPSSAISLIDGGKVVPIAVSSPRRNDRFPNIPTTHEQGTNYDAGFSFGIWAPVKTPEAIMDKITTDVEKAVLSPQYADQMKKLNYEVPPKPRDYALKVRNETRVYGDIAAQVGIKPQ